MALALEAEEDDESRSRGCVPDAEEGRGCFCSISGCGIGRNLDVDVVGLEALDEERGDSDWESGRALIVD